MKAHREFSRRSIGACVALLFGACVSEPAFAQSRDPYRASRERMVAEDLAGEGIANERVLAAMRNVPRHMFVRAALRPMAYYDQALDIGFKQTISPPFIV